MEISSKGKSWVEWLTPPAVAVVAPILLFPSLGTIWVALLVPIAWFTQGRLTKHFFAHNPLNILMVPLFFMVGVSLWATFDILFSLGKVAGTVLGLVIFFTLVQFSRDRFRLLLVVATLLTGTVVLALFSLVGAQWKARLPILRTVAAFLPIRLKGLPGAEEGFHPNAVSVTIVLYLFIFLLLFRYILRIRVGTSRIVLVTILGGSILLTFGVLVLSESRGAWMGFGVRTGLVLALEYRRFRRLLIVGVILGACTLLVLRNNFFWQGLLDLDQISAAGEARLPGRLALWSRAMSGIEDFPYTGMGMNVFRKKLDILYPIFPDRSDIDLASCHNQILQTVLDVGIPGMLIYIGIWVALFRMLFRLWRDTQEDLRRILAQGLLAGFVAYFVFLITDAVPLGAKVGIFFLDSLGISGCFIPTRVRQFQPSQVANGRNCDDLDSCFIGIDFVDRQLPVPRSEFGDFGWNLCWTDSYELSVQLVV